MQVLAVGLNEKTAPVEIREKVALGAEQLKQSLPLLFNYVPQGVILSTCNRTEVYILVDHDGTGRRGVENFLSELGGISATELSPYLYRLQEDKAVRHLFKVASGLESMVLGEFEVLGQVRHALEEAERTDKVGVPLLNLFRQAVWVGRHARNVTAISENAVSVSSAAVKLARKFFPEFSSRRVLVISAGEAGKLTVKTLFKNGISQMVIASRTYERAEALASVVNGRAIPFHQVGEALGTSDIVFSCSGSPHFILETPCVAEAMQTRQHRPLLLIDIAVPRDIVPEVRHIDNVFLYDIDDLEAVLESNRRKRKREVEKVMSIIEFEVSKFMDWWGTLETRPTITALVDKAERIRREQLTKTIKKMQGLSSEDQARIDAVTSSIVRKILHDPISCLKNGEQHGNYIQVVQELFNLKSDTDK
jgi:glutamyl-tRNA reductase